MVSGSEKPHKKRSPWRAFRKIWSYFTLQFLFFIPLLFQVANLHVIHLALPPTSFRPQRNNTQVKSSNFHWFPRALVKYEDPPILNCTFRCCLLLPWCLPFSPPLPPSVHISICTLFPPRTHANATPSFIPSNISVIQNQPAAFIFSALIRHAGR